MFTNYTNGVDANVQASWSSFAFKNDMIVVVYEFIVNISNGYADALGSIIPLHLVQFFLNHDRNHYIN